MFVLLTDPCKSDGACGPNAICSCEGHNTKCTCPPGFQGNPEPQQGCVRVPRPCSGPEHCIYGQECISNVCREPCRNNKDCAAGERCYENSCAKVCHGDGNCLVGEICTEGICRPGCASDTDCSSGQICLDRKCRYDIKLILFIVGTKTLLFLTDAAAGLFYLKMVVLTSTNAKKHHVITLRYVTIFLDRTAVSVRPEL